MNRSPGQVEEGKLSVAFESAVRNQHTIVGSGRPVIERARSVLPYGLIFIVITMSALPMLRSGDKINRNVDFYQYASRHEAVRKSLVEYNSLPLRSHWFGGGYPTLGDPEDPTLNPLVLLSVMFGTVKGLKLIGYVALLVSGLATYAFAQIILGYTRWGALFSGLICGTSLFIPLRLWDGNPNEVYTAFLPLCLLLLGLARQGRTIAVVILPFLLYTMLSDGKANSLMALFYIGVLCLLAMIPSTNALSPAIEETRLSRVDHRPLKFFLLVLGLTALIGMLRILPAAELIERQGGIRQALSSHPKIYKPAIIRAYTFEGLWKDAVGLDGRIGLVTVGWIPVLLSGIAFIAFWRSTLAWGLGLLLFGWLSMAYHARIDLLKLLWHLPVFEAISQPDKYFSFPIVFTLAIAAGRCFSPLSQLRSRWVEGLIATILIALSVGFLYPKAENIQRRIFDRNAPRVEARPEEGFFQIEGMDLHRARTRPNHSLAYFNVQRDVGTLDWYTGVPMARYAVPKYFVDAKGVYTRNPAYRGEAFFEESTGGGCVTTELIFRPNSIAVSVDVKAPCVLVINQNFHRDWHTDHGKLLDRGGRLALQLGETGNHAIHLRYHPRSFYAGLALTFSSLLALVWACWTYNTGRLARWSQRGPLVLKKSSQAILWLIK